MTEPYPDNVTGQFQGDPGAPPVFFLHANSYCACMYIPFLESILEGKYLIAPDLPGHGGSRWHGRIRNWSSLADYFENYLDDLDLNQPLIGIGHSIGGIVNMMMAAKRPDSFSRLVLLDPVLLPRPLVFLIATMRFLGLGHQFPLAKKAYRRQRYFDSRETALDHYRQKRVFARFNEEALSRYVDHCMRPSRQGGLELSCDPHLEASIYRTLPVKAWSLVPRLKVPTLLLVGEHSDTITANSVRRLSGMNPNVVVHTVPGGHLFPFEESARASELIQEFLAT